MRHTQLLTKQARLASGAVALLVIAAISTEAQVPGSPVLQNAFANPGVTVAANITGGGGQSFFGAAAAWGLGAGRLQVSGAAGVARANSSARGAYGGRVAATLWTSASQSLGAGAFAGFGGAARTHDQAGSVNNPAVIIVPVGITVGYRHALGATRGFSAFASPLYRWTRATALTSTSSGNMGVSLGADVSLTQSFGATVGVELGKASGVSKGTSSAFGIGLSFVPGR